MSRQTIIEFIETKRASVEREFDEAEKKIVSLKVEIQESINEIEERIKRQKYH